MEIAKYGGPRRWEPALKALESIFEGHSAMRGDDS